MAEERKVVEGIRPDLNKAPSKKIAILGTCPSRMQAPINDPTWEIWTIGPGGKNNHRWDRLFEIHGNNSWPPGFAQYLEELRAEKPPKIIYTDSPMPDMPAAKPYPRDEMFYKHGRMWFSSSISYAIALAMEEGATDIGLWGIDLESGEEYISQFAGCKHFINLARLAGINLHLPAGCGLLRDPNPYPDAWETHLAQTIMAKQDFIGQLIGQKRNAHAQLAAEINHLEGENAAFDFIKRLYVFQGTDPGRRVETAKEFPTDSGKLDEVWRLIRSR